MPIILAALLAFACGFTYPVLFGLLLCAVLRLMGSPGSFGGERRIQGPLVVTLCSLVAFAVVLVPLAFLSKMVPGGLAILVITFMLGSGLGQPSGKIIGDSVCN